MKDLEYQKYIAEWLKHTAEMKNLVDRHANDGTKCTTYPYWTFPSLSVWPNSVA